jgi:hypothetical protein
MYYWEQEKRKRAYRVHKLEPPTEWPVNCLINELFITMRTSDLRM